MKRSFLRIGVLVLAGVLSLGLVAATAGAAVIFSEDFSYPDGSLVPNGGWLTHSGVAGDLLVSGGVAVVQHGAPSEDANHPFTPVAGTIYYGFDFSVDDLGAPYLGTDNEYFIHLKQSLSTFNFCARVDIVEPSALGDYSVGIASQSSTANSTWGTDLSYGVVYRAVVRFDQPSNIAALWIDPAAETDPAIFGEDGTDPGFTAAEIALRQSDSSENETVRVDNIIVAETFDEALGASSVPGASTAGMMLLASLMLGAGALFVVRRRATVA